uniref:cDNA sequence AB124611 n=1 Tax=Jaculus jaculus TaxID=51337 RepID=A0A8C5NV21_JACJA
AGEAMPWTILLLAAGSLAIPAPSIFLVPPYPSSQEDPIHISCTAPKDFLGANFTLYHGGQVIQLLKAPADQPGVTFNVSGGQGGGSSEAPWGNFRCQYGVTGEHSQPQLSDLSQPVQVSFPVKVKNLQKQRERESCWAQINVPTTDMSFDNTLFAVSMKITSDEDLTATVDPGPRKRPTSVSSSAEFPEFSTFRACQ